MLRLFLAALFITATAAALVASATPLNHLRSSSSTAAPSTWSTIKTNAGPIFSDPATSSDASKAIFFMGAGYEVYAVNSWDFSTNFTHKFTAQIYGSPAVCDKCGRVFVGDNAGNMLAMSYGNGAEGKLMWAMNTSFPITGRPVVYNPPSGGNNILAFGSYDGSIYGVNAKDGTKAWNLTTGSFVSASAALTKTMWNVDAVVIGGQDGYLYGLEVATGKELWKWWDGSANYQADPIADACAITNAGAAICTARKGRFFAVNVSTGKKIFERGQRFDGTPNARPILSSNQASAFFPADFTKMYSVDAASGNVNWSYDHKTAYLRTGAALINFNGEELLVFGTADDQTTIVALNPSSGALVWTATGSYGKVTTIPALAGNKIVFGTSQGVICGLSA